MYKSSRALYCLSPFAYSANPGNCPVTDRKPDPKHRYIKPLTASQNLPRPLRQPAMSDSAPTPAQDTATPSIDTQQLQQPPPSQSLVQDPQLHAQLHPNAQTISDTPRKCAFPNLPFRTLFSSLFSQLTFFFSFRFQTQQKPQP
jgi:hypothetical protein